MSPSLRFRLIAFLIGLFTAMALRGPSEPDTSPKAKAHKKPAADEVARLPDPR